MIKGVSIIVCCFNSSARLPETIRYLAQQQVADNFCWEVIVVDNASRDHTGEIATENWEGYGRTHAGFKVVSEPNPGLSFAREKGLSAAQYEYIVFCDDDNLLFPDFVQNAYSLLERYPDFGVMGSNNHYRNSYSNFITDHYIADYAVGEQANQELEDVTPGRGFVWGAGMVLRKSVMRELKAKNFSSLLTGRKGKKLAAGDDAEICFAIRLLGWKIGASNRLNLYHNVPEERFQLDYLLRLKQGFGRADPYLDLYNAAWKRTLGAPVRFSYRKELFRYIRIIFFHKRALLLFIRGKKEVRNDFIQLHYYLAKVQTLFRLGAGLDRGFLKLVKDYNRHASQDIDHYPFL
ncbi:glycosyltransferase [Paraflavisolibacter sp. H34]|uniref:glycosyltransferase n=1 Tax=Huijunlia imazamoxiresistens TaxID=3127457 RepID=UPI003019ADF8